MSDCIHHHKREHENGYKYCTTCGKVTPVDDIDRDRTIAETKAVIEEQQRERRHSEEQVNRRLFDDWFVGLLYKTQACWERDILRACKEQMFLEWLKNDG